jgi:putative PIN family toxin of toxin-antitoxin system
MIRVVLDTNIVVSAYLNQDGFPFLILKLALSKRVQIWASAPILAEYEEILRRKSYALGPRRAKLTLMQIRAVARIANPTVRLSQTSDPDDIVFLECAQTATAHYLITGNTNHFPPRWKYTEIVTPAASSPCGKNCAGVAHAHPISDRLFIQRFL